MTFNPLKVIGKCVAGDAELFANMDAAIARGYPEVTRQPEREGVIALVGSGPSAVAQLDVIGEMKRAGTPIVGIKDAHDWLQDNGIIPDYALAIDPQAHRWNCFKRQNQLVHYMIASQCNKTMFDHLDGMNVTIWHPYITKGQTHPPHRDVIGGGTTSGLRAISLFYVLGWRHFALFGFDSCLDDGILRSNGDRPKVGEPVHEIRIEEGGETFYCTPSMALQAQHFQDYYDMIPDAVYYPYGHGLIQAIIKKRMENEGELQTIIDAKHDRNERVSFIHAMDKTQASYRYRAQIPARVMRASMNDLTADTLIFAKPQAHELMQMARAKARGAWVVVDFCDDHFDWMHYSEALRLADVITCNTVAMSERIAELGYSASVVPDPYEFPRSLPHCEGTRLLWFGHSVNKHSIDRLMPDLVGYPLVMVSNFSGAIPWSIQTLQIELARADIVIVPETARYKSNNRTLEAIRSGCFVVAEPHPSLEGIPGIWIGNIKEGIEWARLNPQEANRRTLEAQRYVETKFSPQTTTDALRKAIQRPTTSDAGARSGTDG